MEITIDDVTWFDCEFCQMYLVKTQEELVKIESTWIGSDNEEYTDVQFACPDCANSPALKMNAKF